MPDLQPQRIQLRRTSGWRMPQGAIRLDRATKWGNPFRVIQVGDAWHVQDYAQWTEGWHVRERAVDLSAHETEAEARRQSLVHFREYLDRHPDLVRAAEATLRGRTLACWCRPDQPCHADEWLRRVNPQLACEAA